VKIAIFCYIKNNSLLLKSYIATLAREMMKIKVSIVEDDPIVRLHLSNLIEKSLSCRLTGVAYDKKSLLELINKNSADIYLVDMKLPDIFGPEIIATILKTNKNARCLTLSAFGDLHHIASSFNAGACGYILKGDLPENIIPKIEEIFRGDYLISGSVAKILIRPIIESLSRFRIKNIEVDSKLTPRELQVLQLLQTSHPIKRIATELSISIFTANQHIRKIYQKLEVHSRLEAINQARENGIIEK
jgi:DNA-binding NarL/FixJ family response regulator